MSISTTSVSHPIANSATVSGQELELALAFLGSPPLVPGEDAGAYEKLQAVVSSTIKPVDYLEAIWTKDVVDLEWEGQRYRRVKANLINGAKQEALANVLRPYFVHDPDWDPGEPSHQILALQWIQGDQKAIEKVQNYLGSADLTKDLIMAEAVSVKISNLERLDRMIMSSEARRDNALREIEHHRESFAVKPRRAGAKVEDAEFREIGDKPGDEKQPG
jgi:hypothetical protein